MQRRLFLAALGLGPACAADPSPLPIHLGNRHVTNFYSGGKWDKPFLYPLRTPAGTVISRGWPLAPEPGDSTDHPWHRGIWYGHGLINQQDFWRELGADKTSRLVPLGQPKFRGSELTANFALRTPLQQDLGRLQQRFRFQDRGALSLLDAQLRLQAGAASLTFGDTDDGGLAFRLHDAFREDRGALLTNSQGAKGAKAIWGKKASWVHYATMLDGAHVGLLALDHPNNLRYPTGWHARGYALCAANPFADKSFDKSAAPADYTLPAGKRLTLRYRLVLHDGPLHADAINALAMEWANTRT